MTIRPDGVARVMRRRQVLLGTGVALPTIIAGCASEEGSDDGESAGETDDDETESETTDDDGSGNETETDDEGETDSEDEDATEDEADPFDVDSEPPVQGLRITDDDLVQDEYSVTVVGIVVNDSGEELMSVEVAVAFYDADGERVDEGSTRIGDMDDEEEIPFEIMSLEDDAVEYELAIVDGETAEQTFG